MQTNKSAFIQSAASTEATCHFSVLEEVLFSLVAATCYLLWVDVCSRLHKRTSAIHFPRLEAILQNVIISSSVNAVPICFCWRRGLREPKSRKSSIIKLITKLKISFVCIFEYVI